MTTTADTTCAFNKDAIDMVIYHGECPDGFGAALAVWKYFSNNNNNNNKATTIKYMPGFYGTPAPNVTNKNVLICDFSYKKDQLVQMIASAKSLLIIDHHTSAESDLVDIPQNYKIFDMAHSGAYLTWKFMFPNDAVPLLISYIEDNDIWLKQMPHTQEVTSYIATLPFTFDDYDTLLQPNAIADIAIPLGTILTKQNDKNIKKCINGSHLRFVEINKEYYMVAVANSNILQSNIGNELLSKYKYCDFALVYYCSGIYNTCRISLRSDDTKCDVSHVAGHFGGGGHRNAAGCAMQSVDDFGTCIYDGSTCADIYTQIHSLDYEYGIVKSINGCNKQFNYVMLNHTNNVNIIGKYVLRSCCRGCSDASKKLDFSFVWFYRGNETWYTVTWCMATHDKDTIIALFKNFDHFEMRCTPTPGQMYGQATFRLEGLNLMVF